jgi:catechol 2,3-dioxygenase-like lactoylglutathione lyase family enzyme
MIGVSDIERALPLYRDLLAYDRVVYDEAGQFADLRGLPGGERRLRRVLLSHSEPRKGPFSQLLGPSEIELVQALDDVPGRRIFGHRFWGDLGFIHLCFDVTGMEDLKDASVYAGFPFTIDSQDSFDMGEAAGRFAYIEDPDGTLIEFVETHKMPLLKKFGWYLDLQKRSPAKPLPRWMIKALALGRVKP